MADVTPHWSSPPGQHDEICVNAYSTQCIDRWWFGVWINVANVSHRRLYTYPTLKVWAQWWRKHAAERTGAGKARHEGSCRALRAFDHGVAPLDARVKAPTTPQTA